MSQINNFEKITSFKTPEESPGYLLWSISLLWRGLIEDTLKPLDLTHPQFVVLATTGWLTRNGEHINQTDISKTASLDPNTTSQILRSLEAKNFIKRTRSINEKSKNPSLTDIGITVLAKALPAVEHADSKFFETLSVTEKDTLVKIFQKLLHKKASN